MFNRRAGERTPQDEPCEYDVLGPSSSSSLWLMHGDRVYVIVDDMNIIVLYESVF